MKKKHRNHTLLAIKAAALVALVAGAIYADHQVETLLATYDVRAIEKTSWADYQDYLTLKAQKSEQAAANAIKPAPTKKTKTQKVSAVPTPPTPSKFAQADQIGIFIAGRGK